MNASRVDTLGRGDKGRMRALRGSGGKTCLTIDLRLLFDGQDWVVTVVTIVALVTLGAIGASAASRSERGQVNSMQYSWHWGGP